MDLLVKTASDLKAIKAKKVKKDQLDVPANKVKGEVKVITAKKANEVLPDPKDHLVKSRVGSKRRPRLYRLCSFMDILPSVENCY